jgi:hypothetical protein
MRKASTSSERYNSHTAVAVFLGSFPKNPSNLSPVENFDPCDRTFGKLAHVLVLHNNMN